MRDVGAAVRRMITGVLATWLIALSIHDANAQPVSIDAKTAQDLSINVARESQSVPSNLMAAPAALTVTWPWSMFSPSVTAVRLRNETTRPIGIGPPVLLGFSNAEGAANLNGVALDVMACPLLLPAGASCAFKVTLGQWLWPGMYTLDVGVGGAAGGWSQQTLSISSGVSIIIAFAIAAAGVWVGVVADEWRKHGRPLVDALIRLTSLKESLTRFSAGTTLAEPVQLLRQDIERWLERFSEVPPDDAAIATLQDRYDRLVQANLVTISVNRIDDTGKRIFASRIAALISLITEPQLAIEQANRLPPLLRDITEDIRTWPRAQTMINDANGLLQTLTGLAELVGDDPDGRPMLDGLRGKIDAALTTLQKPFAAGLSEQELTDTLGERVRAISSVLRAVQDEGLVLEKKAEALLAAQIASLKGASRDRLSARLNAQAGEEWRERSVVTLGIWRDLHGDVTNESVAVTDASTTGAAVLIQDVKFDFLAGIWGQTAEQMRQRRARNERRWNVAVIGLFALGLAVSTITPIWGSASDIARLFLAGVGARLALAALTNK